MARGKLVRDQIPAIIAARGGVPVTRTAEAEEYRQLLRDKLAEEAGEAASAGPGDLAGELADVLEAVAAIAAEAGISPQQLEDIRAAKAAGRGGFSDRVVWMGNRGDPAPLPQFRGLTAMLREAHAHFGASAPDVPTTDVDPDCEAKRGEWLRQEVTELEKAIDAGDLRQIGKEGADVMYVAAGTLMTFGIDPDRAMVAVHASNMTKEAAGNAKAIKGPGYQPADMDSALWPDGGPAADLEAT